VEEVSRWLRMAESFSTAEFFFSSTGTIFLEIKIKEIKT
jgi:hypothetical protein